MQLCRLRLQRQNDLRSPCQCICQGRKRGSCRVSGHQAQVNQYRQWTLLPLAVFFYTGANIPIIPDGYCAADWEILPQNGGRTMNAPTKETMAKYLQLTHWNKLLYEKGVITQREYLKMANMIRQKYPVTQ